jgi:transcriptional regulator GlxA family with amidase domain
MSLSTFKRHFMSIYHESPGKWLQAKRLARAKEMLSQGK